MTMNKVNIVSPRWVTCIVAGMLVSSVTFAAHAASSCVGLDNCERKICEKNNELEKAKKYGDVSKVLGLQHSLTHLEDSCVEDPKLSLEKYKNDLQELKEEYQQDLDDALNEYEKDFSEAKSEAKSDKIRRAKEKYEHKVQQYTEEYERKLKQL